MASYKMQRQVLAARSNLPPVNHKGQQTAMQQNSMMQMMPPASPAKGMPMAYARDGIPAAAFKAEVPQPPAMQADPSQFGYGAAFVRHPGAPVRAFPTAPQWMEAPQRVPPKAGNLHANGLVQQFMTPEQQGPAGPPGPPPGPPGPPGTQPKRMPELVAPQPKAKAAKAAAEAKEKEKELEKEKREKDKHEKEKDKEKILQVAQAKAKASKEQAMKDNQARAAAAKQPSAMPAAGAEKMITITQRSLPTRTPIMSMPIVNAMPKTLMPIFSPDEVTKIKRLQAFLGKFNSEAGEDNDGLLVKVDLDKGASARPLSTADFETLKAFKGWSENLK
eukprot:gnl/TRDRNA2_/TRDRNA2_135209_c1_seq2.p1 gnl/TRDRNA2_/TRDRNA2_135209_c1~~gnl/TRDRNA2_/TRDRNA2_135209_c1_seq2.p1  ORF type:complete len:387 (-),score=99.75 gnl/TRDRNA2_/TRDRNA2_135209_c1_seq2:55-1053(-)